MAAESGVGVVPSAIPGSLSVRQICALDLLAGARILRMQEMGE